ncbi:MAG: metal-dependent hydrolase [Myxococcales bacterium]
MFVLGHIGIGSRLLPRGLRAPRLWRWMALGCLLPDLIDKPIWLAAPALLAAHPDARAVLSGTRLFGHTLLLVGFLTLGACALRARRAGAVALGALTHLFIDLAGDLLSGPPATWQDWLLWPAFGWRFPTGDGRGIAHHFLAISEHRVYLVGEVVGAAILLVDYFRWRLGRDSGRVLD